MYTGETGSGEQAACVGSMLTSSLSLEVGYHGVTVFECCLPSSVSFLYPAKSGSE